MKLIRLKADGFGVLRGEYQFAAGRLNLVMDRNERGKTSLLHAIVAGLYGLDRDGRRYRGLMTPLERWRPWDGGSYCVELEVESEGETYTIVRDFARGTTQIWNARAQDVTAEFMTEKDDFAVGQQLLGLDAEEFAKCAFWRQGELAEVVPDLEKERRTSGLQARLESAADTRSGDASAIEAIQALDSALAHYTSGELATTITADNAIKRLQALRDSLAVEIQSLEHDYRSVAGSLEEIAGLADEERSLRATMRAIDARRLQLRTEDAARRLERDAAHGAEIERLRGEAGALEYAASVPGESESTLAALAARHDEAGRRIAARRGERDAVAAEVAAVDTRLAEFAPVAACDAEDADRMGIRAGELRRVTQEETRLLGERESTLAAIRANGLDPARAMLLLPKFAAMTGEQADFVREQPRLALVHQTAIAVAEQSRAVGRSTLREVGLWKRPRYAIGAALLALGLVTIVLALTGLLLVLPSTLIGSGAAAALAGGGILAATAAARRAPRQQALDRIAAAADQIRRAESRTAENETRLRRLATEFGYQDPAVLISEWDESQRLRDLHPPVQAAEQHLAAVDRQWGELVEDAGRLLARAGGGEPTPERLDEVAACIRRRIELVYHRTALTHRLGEMDAEIRALEDAASEIAGAARATIATAGLPPQGEAPWAEAAAEIAARVRAASRRRAILESQIPSLERERLDPATLGALRAEIERAAGASVGIAEEDLAATAAIGTAAAAEARIGELRGRLEQVQAERETLERAIHGTTQRYHAEHPGHCARLGTVEDELRRAERFRDAVLHARGTIERVARETHRRWADFLNRRVAELLESVGSNVSQIRFGEDLDFALTMTGGTQTARGRALHQLSAGARDQLHLAVRLAISEFLSRGGERLPLLIDDCFATSDDERASAGMRLLLETFAHQHQIVLVTCHRRRYETLAARDAALYDERVSWLELRAGEDAEAPEPN